ncbi:MAG: hypothetical protein ABIJ97_02020 [Bacteroidota bacterium]
MKTLLIFLLFAFFQLSLFSQVNSEQVVKPITSTDKEQIIGWTGTVEELVAHLNNWDKDEIHLYENAAAFPDKKTSGETNAWIALHKKKIEEMGASVYWDADLKEYKLNKEDK